MSLLPIEQRRRAQKSYSIPVRDGTGKIVSYRCYDGGDIFYELFKDDTGNFEKNALTIGDVLQLFGLPVTFDDQWNIQITPALEPYYMEIWEIMDLNDSGRLRHWRNSQRILGL